MTSAIVVAPAPPVSLIFRRSVERDETVREQSRQKRSEILDAVAKHPDADPGLRRQAKFYRDRLAAGRERPDDNG